MLDSATVPSVLPVQGGANTPLAAKCVSHAVSTDWIKWCQKCKSSKPVVDFYQNNHGKPSSYCKSCASLYAGEWAIKNRLRKREINKTWRDKNPERIKTSQGAVNKLWSAMRSGKVARGLFCEQCGATDAIEGAHFDYSKPLEVRWLCRKCHRKWDANDPKTFTATHRSKAASDCQPTTLDRGAKTGATTVREQSAQEPSSERVRLASAQTPAVMGMNPSSRHVETPCGSSASAIPYP